MLSYKPVVLIPANENLLANSNQLDGPFLVSRDKAHDFKCFLKNAQWSMIQMAKYLAFIEENTKKIQGKAHKHLWGIYQEMGKYITTRNFRQVKSYHQKMVQKYNTIPQIISFHLINYPTIIPILEKQKQSLKILSINSQHSIQNIENIKTLIPTTESYLNESNQNILLKKEQQWKQCHQLFISWTNKLKNLTMMYV